VENFKNGSLGLALALPATIRLDWKSFLGTNTSKVRKKKVL